MTSSDTPGRFESFANWVSQAVGTATAFALALFATIVWAISGPILHWSNTWQLIANTATTIITWLMIFLLQHTQNRDTLEIKRLLEEMNSNG